MHVVPTARSNLVVFATQLDRMSGCLLSLIDLLLQVPPLDWSTPTMFCCPFQLSFKRLEWSTHLAGSGIV